MPHTTTKAHRSKRPDTRPNAKQRRILQKKLDKEEKIEDIRVTRIKASDRKERIVGPLMTTLKSVGALNSEEKRLRALRKKLRQINNLIEKRDQESYSLDEQQQRCVDQLDQILQEIAEIIQSQAQCQDNSTEGDR